MTLVNTLLLTVGMCVVGVPLFLGLLAPVAGTVVVNTLPETAWDGAMLLFIQASAALATFLLGTLTLGLPWYAALPAALFVGITSYARRTE